MTQVTLTKGLIVTLNDESHPCHNQSYIITNVGTFKISYTEANPSERTSHQLGAKGKNRMTVFTEKLAWFEEQVKTGRLVIQNQN